MRYSTASVGRQRDFSINKSVRMNIVFVLAAFCGFVGAADAGNGPEMEDPL